MKEETKNCFACGSKLLRKEIGAEDFYFNSEAGRIYMYQPYNTKTGKRQAVTEITCPNFKRNWLGVSNGHQKGFLDDLHTAIKLK